MDKIGETELDGAFFGRLLKGKMFKINEYVISDHVQSEKEIEEITARRAFEFQGMIQKAVKNLGKTMQTECDKHFLQVMPSWYKVVSDKKNRKKFVYQVCYTTKVINEEELKKRINKNAMKKKEKENKK